jgi:ketosteroid isomerase-like protein
MEGPGVARLAEQVRAALAAADLERFAELLDPRVTWGAAGDPAPPCRTREQVLAWYAQGKSDGRRARVLEVTPTNNKILVTMKVTGRHPADDATEEDRWQVLTVAGGRITEIRGYDDRAAAQAAADTI